MSPTPPDTASPPIHSLLGWLVAGGAAFVGAIVGFFRWAVRTITREVIDEVMKDHQADENAHQKAAEKRHAWIEETLESLVKRESASHELMALLIQSHNAAIQSGTCPAMVQMRRRDDPSDSDMTPLRQNGGHRGKP